MPENRRVNRFAFVMSGLSLAAAGLGVAQTTQPGTQPATRAAATQAATQAAPRAATPPAAAALTWPVTHPAALPKGMEEFRTTETCKTTTIVRGKEAVATVDEPGYLGVSIEGAGNKLAVGVVSPDSPAAKAGFKAADVIVSVEGHVPGNAEDFRELIQCSVQSRC